MKRNRPIIPAVKINAIFTSINSTAFDVHRLAIPKGQTVVLQLNTPGSANIEWFANHDEVLDVNANNNKAVIKSLELGTSLIELQFDGNIVKAIEIDVIASPATAVRLLFGKPEHK